MSAGPRRSRRAILSSLAALLGWLAAPRRGIGQQGSEGDRGIGGTGAAPELPDGDRGIGGTGVIGTIRRFGSIVVNDLRITYPKDVAVLIDGAPAAASDLRLGHVVRTVATREGGTLTTRRIEVTSEVVGRIEATHGSDLTVLGQTVSTAELRDRHGLEVGQRVAVSGLRRNDGTIVASRIDPREAGPDRIAGPLVRTGGGDLAIGGQRLVGADPALAGSRVIAEGRLGPDGLAVSHATDERRLITTGIRRLSIEGYIERSPTGLRLGSGLAMSGLPRSAQRGRVIVSTGVDVRGGLRAERVQSNRSERPGSRPAETPGRPAGPGGRRGAGPGREPAGPGGGPGSRPDGAGRPGRTDMRPGGDPGSDTRPGSGSRDLPIDMRGPGETGRGPSSPGGSGPSGFGGPSGGFSGGRGGPGGFGGGRR